MAPSLTKGFYLGGEDIGATKRFLVYPGKERYPITKDLTVLLLIDMTNELKSRN